MNIFQRIGNAIAGQKSGEVKEKAEVIVEGGIDLLAKLVPQSMSKRGALEKYRKSLYVFACVRKIAEKVSSVPLELYRVKNRAGDMEPVNDHEALDLLYKCNPFQTRSEFWQITIINLKCTGDAFWFKVRDTRGRVAELWNLRPDLMTVVSDPLNFVKGYELRKEGGEIITFAPEDVVHFRSPDPLNDYGGMSPLKAAQTRIEIEEHAGNYQRDFFLNSARPDAILKTQGALTKEQKEEVKEGWNRRYRGPGKASKIAVMQGGLEYQLISLSQKEMDFIESQKFTRDDILVAFGVPKSVVGITEDVNRANAEAGYAIFLGETIDPTTSEMVEKIQEELITPDFGLPFILDFERQKPDDKIALREELNGYVQSGVMLINEAREKLGLPPVKGGWSLYMPISNVPVGGLPTEKGIKIGGEDERGAFEGARPGKTKRFDFRGKPELRKYLELKDAIKSELHTKMKKKEGGKSLLQGEEVQKVYAEMINKRIDKQSEGFLGMIEQYAKDQEKRVIARLEKAKGKKRKINVSISSIFDKAAENKIAVNLVIPFITSALADSANEAIDMVNPAEDFTLTSQIEKIIKERAKFFAKSVNSTTLDGLERTLAEGISSGEGIAELRKRIEDVYKDFPAYRSELIARTEATAANNKGLVEGWKQSDVANAKEWINAGDGRVRDEHLDAPAGVGGEIVKLDEAFSNGLMEPGEPNCRCVLGPAFIE